MSTGDMKNNLRKLRSCLNAISYHGVLDLDNIIKGLAVAFLPILHYAFFEYSDSYSSYLSDRGYEFYGKSDVKFMEVVCRILIQEHGIKPMLTKDQFFSVGYAEIRVIFVTKILELIRDKHKSLTEKTARSKKTIMKLKQRPKPFGHEHMEVESSTGPPSHDNDANKKDKLVSMSFKAPRPHPDLALTPLKPNVKETKSLGTKSELSDFDQAFNVESDLGPVDDAFTENDDDSPDISELETTECVLPKCTVICHNTVPENFDITCVKPVSMSDECCRRCLNNESRILQLQSQVEILTSRLQSRVASGNELSARILLLETQVKLLCEGSLKKRIDSVDVQLSNVSTSQDQPFKGGLIQGIENRCSLGPEHASSVDFGTLDQPSKVDRPKKTVHFSLTNAPTTNTTSYSTYSREISSYSPTAYVDDEEIIKDFKPLRMSDVQGLLSSDNSNKNRVVSDSQHLENTLNSPENFVSATSAWSQVTTPDIISDADPNNSFLPNSSFIFENESTRKTLASLKSRFLETEKMLRDHYKTS